MPAFHAARSMFWAARPQSKATALAAPDNRDDEGAERRFSGTKTVSARLSRGLALHDDELPGLAVPRAPGQAARRRRCAVRRRRRSRGPRNASPSRRLAIASRVSIAEA